MAVRRTAGMQRSPSATAHFLRPSHEYISKGALSNPHAPALRAFSASEGEDAGAVYSLTYSELDAAARAVGRMMAGSGVRPGSRVALLIPRGVEAVLALVGASVAGAAYVPLNAAAPVARLVQLCRAAEVAVVATTKQHIDLGFELVGTLGAALLLVDRHHHHGPGIRGGDPDVPDTRACLRALPEPSPRRDGEDAESEDTNGRSSRGGGSGPLPSCSIDDGMVVLFTSGTTAKPKAMELTHRAALHHVAFYAAEFAARSPVPVVAACMSALVFDMHISELFPPWATGGCVALLDAPDNDLHARVRCLEHATISMWVPSVLRSCLQAFVAMGVSAAHMRQVFVAGEQLVVSLVQAVFDAWEGVEEVINAYGPAETHVVTVHRVLRDCWPPAGVRHSPSVPIGRAVPGVRLELRNRTISAGGGLEGELLVSGPCLASGYIGNASKTSEKFLVDEGGVRWYRTGDHVELTLDGDWLFIGRIDAMLKNRGRRIEPEWVEAVAREAGADEALLASVSEELLLAFAGAADPDAVGRHLAAVLDTYSVPDHILRVPDGFAWPRLASGKLDRASGAAHLAALRDAELAQQRLGGSGSGGSGSGGGGNGGSGGAHPHCNKIVADFLAGVASLSSRPPDPSKPLQLNSIQVMTLVGVLNLNPAQARLLRSMPEVSVETLAIQVHKAAGASAPEAATPLRKLADLADDRAARPRDPAPVFICPGAFGRTSNLRNLAKELVAAGLGPVYGFETPVTEPRPDSVDDLGSLFADAIADAKVKLEGRGCVIVGQSFGALLALSLEAHLRRRGHRVGAVVALDPRRQCWLDAPPPGTDGAAADPGEPPPTAKALQGHLRYTAALRAITMGSPELRVIYEEIRDSDNPCEAFRSRMPPKQANQTRAILRETETMVGMLDYSLALWKSIPENHFRPTAPLLVLQAASEDHAAGAPGRTEATRTVLAAMCCSHDPAPDITRIPVAGDHFTIGYRDNAVSAAEAIKHRLELAGQ
eukprot:jgi/Tetstr1/427684/TSEL_017809.t1